MDLISQTAIEKFEESFSTLIVNRYNLATDCLIYDATNFFTYIDTKSSSEMAQRGHCKSKRYDLKIVGLAMMATPDFNIPLFYEMYPGNRSDSEEFGKVLDKLKQRFAAICPNPQNITLVFDKGNNSGKNLEEIYQDETRNFHVVGSIKRSEHKDLLDIPKKQFEPVSTERYLGVTVYRCRRQVYGKEMTILIVHNPMLLAGQMQGVEHDIEKCTVSLNELKATLEKRIRGEVTKGRKPTVDSVQKHVRAILHAEFMADIFEVVVTASHDGINLSFTLYVNKLEYIKEHFLGKTILFTDNHHWPDVKIVEAYRSQYHIEFAFRQMKDTQFLEFRPILHWTDQKIKVHAFYCVLALRLSLLLQRILHQHNIHLSVDKMLSSLGDIYQIITVYPPKGASKKDRESFSLTQMEPEQKEMFDVLNIGKYALGG